MTDYKNEPDSFWLQGREGFACGRSNNDGYNSIFHYERDMIIPILMMGSSHMLAEEITPEENAASQLSRLSGRLTYNIGMGAHGFTTCAINLRAALKKYKPVDYVIIETFQLNPSEGDLKRVLDDNIFKQPAHNTGIASLLRQNSFLRLMYHQFFRDLVMRTIVPKHNSPEDFSHENTSALLSEVLRGLKRTASSYNVKLMIAYHPYVLLNKDGTISIDESQDVIRRFSELCEQNGIFFLDMSQRFLNEYAENHILPYGFWNTSVGRGHMNIYGQTMFAEEIYKLIQRIEAQS